MTRTTWRQRATHEAERFRELARERLKLLRLLPLGSGSRNVGAVPGLLGAHLLAALIPTLTAVTIGWLTARLVAVIRDDAPVGSTALPLGLLAGLMLLEEVVVAAREVMHRATAGRIDGRVRRRVRELVLAPRGISHLDDPTYMDDVSRASDTGTGHRSPGNAVAGQVLLCFRMFSAVVAAGLVATFSVPLALCLLLASMLMRSIIRRQWMRIAKVKDGRERGARRTRYWSQLAGGKKAAKEIRLFGLGDWVVARRTREAVDWASGVWQVRREILARQWWAIGIASGSAAAGLFFPGLAHYNGSITTAELVTVLAATFAVFQISSMGLEAFDIEHGLDAVRALDRLEKRAAPLPAAAAKETATATPAASSVSPRPADIRLEKVTFSYPGARRSVLDQLDLHVRPGEVLAIVGTSGVGKTTLIKLLAGLYEPTSGRITVDGTDLAELDADAWRRRLGVVFQDFNRYPLTAAENIALGAPEWREDRETAQRVLSRISNGALPEKLPKGLDTVMSAEISGGTDLSGGQWQQLALARALFSAEHGRDLIVLDEPTAHLDVEAEADFYQRVVTEVRGRSVVLISHRASTIRHADRIVLLRDGRVAEDGNHRELMDLDGEYARLFRLQASRFTGAPQGGVHAEEHDAGPAQGTTSVVSPRAERNHR